MNIPLQIEFRDLAHSDAIETAIREKAEKLDRFFDHIMSCRITVGMVQKHKHQGKLFNIRIDITVPGAEVVASRDKAEDIYAAIRDAFDAARRQLQDYVQRMRRNVKLHEAETRGRVARLFPEEGYGFIEKPDGSTVYFDIYNCVHPDFDQLKVGDEVAFLEELAAEGRQANRVKARSQRTTRLNRATSAP